MSTPPSTRRVVVSATSIDVIEAETPRVGAGEVLVHMRIAGVCGSDTHAARGEHPFITLPYHPGHEVVGTVDAVGAGVDPGLQGRRITVEPTLPCGTCKMCTTDRSNLCERLQFFGCGWAQGAMADYFTIAADRVHIIPDGLDDVTGALIEPLSTPVHAVRLAGDVQGKAVVVLGAGPIGLLVVAVLKARGARRIVVTDLSQHKRARAVDIGATDAVDAAAHDAVDRVRTALGESADVVFDCVAIQSTIAQAVTLAGKGGTVVVVGVPTRRELLVPLAAVQDQQIRIQGSATYLPEDIIGAIDLLRNRDVHADQIVTAVFGLTDAAQAFAASGSSEQIKVLLQNDRSGAPDAPPVSVTASRELRRRSRCGGHDDAGDLEPRHRVNL